MGVRFDGNGHIAFASPWTPTNLGNFEIEFVVTVAEVAGQHFLTGRSNKVTHRFFGSNLYFGWEVDGGGTRFKYATAANPEAGVQARIKYVFTSTTTVDVYKDGTLVEAITIDPADAILIYELDAIGSRVTGTLLDGTVMHEVRLTDLETPANSSIYLLDEGSGTVANDTGALGNNGTLTGFTDAEASWTTPPKPTIMSASDIADESQTSSFVLKFNSADPTAVTVNGVAATNLQMVSEDVGAGTQTWSYTPPLIADDATADLVVTVDGADTTAFQIAYENSYDRSQTAHGEPAATSVNFGNTYASANPYEWKVITDTNPTIAIVDWNLMESSDGMNLGIENFITTVAEGITSAEIGVFIPETGQTATFTRTFEISTDGSISNPDPEPEPEPEPDPEPEPTLPTTLDEVQVNVRGRVLTFIDIGDGFGILKDALSAVDLRTMEDVSDNGVGSTLKSKIENHRMGNGRKVTDVYKNAIVNISGYGDQIEKKVLTSKKAETISSHASRLDSLENP